MVFDEADRLFEMGLGDQLREILARLPDTRCRQTANIFMAKLKYFSVRRQTVLFSATLPKLLVDFAKAGLSDPTLVRLDVETKVIMTMLMMK